MQVATGTVVNGRIVLEGVQLAEGTLVTVVARGADAGFSLTPEDERELMSCLEEIERGESLSLDEVLESLWSGR